MTTPAPTPVPEHSGGTRAVQLLSETQLVHLVLADDYEIFEELGHGGMAVVFRAREKALDREVAIKVLPSRFVADHDFVERFQHEARTAAKLEHPNIIPVYRVGRGGPNGEVIYFVMKLLRGQSLSTVLRERGKLTPAEVRRVLLETGSALGYAAKRSVVHRDIKPDNIMLDSEGRCVVTDFGIAKAPGGQQTSADTSLGTPRYMSPEHAKGEQLDGRSDMYSLGVVAYECLFGKPPFNADDPFALLYKHINDPVPEPTLHDDDERQLYGVIKRMLAKKPDERYQNANELIVALGGEVSDPTLLAAAMAAMPGLIAPTEMMVKKPWKVRALSRFTSVGRPVWFGLAAVLVLAWTALMAGRRPGTPKPSSSTTLAQLPTVVQQASAFTLKPETARVVTPPPAPSKPVPSARAAAILLANKVKSSCPTRDTLVKSAALLYEVRLPEIADRVMSDSMPVTYDVCGLSGGSPFHALFTLSKMHQRGFGQQKAHTETAVASAGGARTRQKWTLDTHEMSAGDYQLDVLVTDGKQRQTSASREFKISPKG